MGKIKKGVIANVIFPMVDGTDFASLESGITASDFNSAATRQYIGYNIGASATAAFANLSKATNLVTSGIFHQVLNETETDFDIIMLRFTHPSCADQLLVFETVDYGDSDIYSYLVALSGLISDVDSQVNLTATSNYLSALDSNLLSYLAGMSGAISDLDSALVVHDANLSDQVSNAQSAIALLATSAYLSDVQSNLLSYLAGMSNTISTVYELVSDVDSALTVHDAALSAQVSDAQSAIALLATSNYLSAVHSDLYSAIGNVSVTLTASDISDIASAVTAATADASDIASAVWSEKYNVYSAVDSSFGSFVTQQVQGASNMLSNISLLVSDVDSAVTVNYNLISDVESALDALADASDVGSAVWANAVGASVASRVLVIQSLVSDVDSQLVITASQIVGMSDILSDVAVAAGTAHVVQAHVSDAGPTAASFDTTLTNTTDNTYADWLLRFIDGGLAGQTKAVYSYNGTTKVISFDENFTSAPTSGDSFVLVPFHVHPITQIAGLAADQVWDEPYSDHLTGSTLGSRVQYIVSGLSDLDSALVVHDAALTSHDSNLSAQVSDVQSYLVALSGLISDVDSQLNLIPTTDLSAALANVDSQVTANFNLISDVDSALTVHDAAVSAAISDLDSQVNANYDLISDVESQLDLTASVVSDIDSQLLVTHSLLSDVESAVDSIWTTALTESYNADGSAATAAQLLYGIFQNLTEFAINSTTITVKKLDGSTTAMTFTLDDDTSPTSRTRVT